jgi:hypothetical protein
MIVQFQCYAKPELVVRIKFTDVYFELSWLLCQFPSQIPWRFRGATNHTTTEGYKQLICWPSGVLLILVPLGFTGRTLQWRLGNIQSEWRVLGIYKMVIAWNIVDMNGIILAGWWFGTFFPYIGKNHPQ